MIRLTAALGNPGPAYSLTRHNIGWIVLDKFLEGIQVSWKKKFHSQYTIIPELQTHFIKPLTFMNLSGTAVSSAAKFFSIEPEEILVIHDDTEIPFGQVCFRKSGGLRGHKGLKSIRDHLNSLQFQRITIGIGRPARGDVSSYVTGTFSDLEISMLPDIVSESVKILEDALRGCAIEGKPAVF